MPAAAPDPGRQGLVLGRYRPLRPLGSGGSGSVWLARDEASGLEVALKIIAREGKAGARAEREAAAAGRLRHERCLRAYALAHDDDHVYIAYEYVPGRTMREALRGGALDDSRSIEAAVQILDGLAHAHARGIIHRDVKPSNVLLADGDDVSVRLLDFGLARMDEADTLTAVGDVPGTLAYIAPERLAGKQATPAADVWAVGVLLWEALAGCHPFWKPSLLESARAIGAGAPPLATMRPDLPKPLLAAVDRALSLDPARRPSAAKLAASLQGARERQSRPGRRATRFRSPVRLAPAALAALVTAWTATTLPFYPAGSAAALAALAAATTLFLPRLGLAFVLAVPVLPLGNLSFALALLYALAAVLWLVLFAREPHGGLLAALGALLAPLAALGFLPLALQSLRSPIRRAAGAAAGVLLAAVVAGVHGSPLPFGGERLDSSLALAGREDAIAVATAFGQILAAHPALGWEALALAAGAAALPYARALGLWGIAGFGAALMALLVLPTPGVSPFPLVLAVWVTCAALASSARVELGQREAS